MLHLSRWKVILVLAATLVSLLFAMPNLLPAETRAKLPSWLPNQTLNLGLDLQGGSYLLLEVDTRALKTEKLNNLVEDLRTNLRRERITFSDLTRSGDVVGVRITDPSQIETAYQELMKLSPTLPSGVREFQIARRDAGRFEMTMTDAAAAAEGADAVKRSIETIRRRVDALGTKEASIVQQGADRIVVQAPGESDPERLKAVIGKTAKLTFQMVDDSVTPEEVAAGTIPPDAERLPSDEPSEPQIVVKRRAIITGEMLQSASQSYDQGNKPVVAFRFNSQGSRRFAETTAQNVQKRFAIVLDGRVISAPVIQEPITGGQGQISGNFTEQSAGDLALLLRSGALPAPLTVEEQRTVGAELGADAVDAGMISTAIAFVIVLVFMVLAYGFLFGGFSIIALLVNGLMIIAAMSMTQATLTLPGIAGLILTLAVAVDANVLIYERMRDEARAGRSPIMAAEAGFSRAMETIIDANLTTLGAAAILFFFGAGPVRGFAWTLSIGVFTSVFTAVLVTQVLLGWWFKTFRPKKLPIV